MNNIEGYSLLFHNNLRAGFFQCILLHHENLRRKRNNTIEWPTRERQTDKNASILNHIVKIQRGNLLAS